MLKATCQVLNASAAPYSPHSVQTTYKQPEEEVQFSFKLDTGAACFYPFLWRAFTLLLRRPQFMEGNTAAPCGPAGTGASVDGRYKLHFATCCFPADLYALAKAKTTAHSIDISRDGSKFVTFSADG